MSQPWLTPAQARQLAAEAERLAEQLEQLRAGREDDDDQARRDAGFRLEEVIGVLRRDVAAQLEETAGDLARLASRPAGSCPMPSGVCPEHGPTLSQSGTECWCTAPGCGRRWGYWRFTQPCAEPVTHLVRFAAGETVEVCDGHAIEARLRVVGGTVTPLERS